MRKYTDESFGSWLRELRLDRGLTLREFSRLLDISPTYISNVERSRSEPPTPEMLRNFSILLGCDELEMIDKAGKLPEDFAVQAKSRPALTEMYRAAFALTEPQLVNLANQVKQLTLFHGEDDEELPN